MVGQTPKDTPFGLDANVAAGLAYLLGILGGIIMLVGGGTNKFVKWSAAQSITIGISWIALIIVCDILMMFVHALIFILAPATMIIGLLVLVAYIWCLIQAFQGKEVRLPVVGDFTQQIFGGMIG